MSNPTLKDDIKEEEEHHKKYFLDLKEEPLRVSQTLFNRSELFMEFVINIQTSSNEEVLYPLIGISYELLLKSILLNKKINIIYDESKLKTISFKECIHKIELLLNKLDKEDKERVIDVLKIIQLKRNTHTHFSYSSFDTYRTPYQIFYIYYFLTIYFFQNSKESLLLKQIKNKMSAIELQQKESLALDYTSIDLEKYFKNSDL